MLAPETFIKARLVTIAEPLDGGSGGPYLECAECAECFEDGECAYVVGNSGSVYLHTGCI